MMRVKPEGLWPSATRRRELRDEAGESALDEPEGPRLSPSSARPTCNTKSRE
jgi:branched-chain amino acid transport system permease protein